MLTAIRATAPAGPKGLEGVARRARELGFLGWVRSEEDRALRLHAAGEQAAIDALLRSVGATQSERVPVEGHEQFAIRGIPGVFVVQ